jgi:hypothetical protein
MIVRKDRTYETNTLFPNSDWYSEGNYVIDETKEESKELIQKIKDHAPYMELVLEGDKIVDIIPKELPISEIEPICQEPTLEERVMIAEDIINFLLGL